MKRSDFFSMIMFSPLTKVQWIHHFYAVMKIEDIKPYEVIFLFVFLFFSPSFSGFGFWEEKPQTIVSVGVHGHARVPHVI